MFRTVKFKTYSFWEILLHECVHAIQYSLQKGYSDNFTKTFENFMPISWRKEIVPHVWVEKWKTKYKINQIDSKPIIKKWKKFIRSDKRYLNIGKLKDFISYLPVSIANKFSKIDNTNIYFIHPHCIGNKHEESLGVFSDRDIYIIFPTSSLMKQRRRFVNRKIGSDLKDIYT